MARRFQKAQRRATLADARAEQEDVAAGERSLNLAHWDEDARETGAIELLAEPTEKIDRLIIIPVSLGPLQWIGLAVEESRSNFWTLLDVIG